MINDLDFECIKFPVSKKKKKKKKILAKLKDKTIFALLYFVMKIIWLILFIYQIKSFIIPWICC